MDVNQFFIYFATGYSQRGKVELWHKQNCLRLSLKQLSAVPEHVVFSVQGKDYFREANKIVRVERTIWSVKW